MNGMDRLKISLWKFGLKNNDICPLCKKKLIKTGFEDEIFGQRYVCKNPFCKFVGGKID